jgi:hypothetical protein
MLLTIRHGTREAIGEPGFNLNRQPSMNPYRAKRRANHRHRQAVGGLVHLSRNTGPEITITAVLPALAGVCS